MSRNLIKWEQTTPRGNMFPYALKSEDALTTTKQKEIREFCRNLFGEGEVGAADRRWFYYENHDYVAFKTETDMVLFVAMWTGDV